jgi:hypothetical protein
VNTKSPILRLVLKKELQPVEKIFFNIYVLELELIKKVYIELFEKYRALEKYISIFLSFSMKFFFHWKQAKIFLILTTIIIHGQVGGTGPQNTNCSQRLLSTKKTSTGEKVEIRIHIRIFFGPYELEIQNCNQIRIRIYVLDVFAVKIRIGPLIFPRYDELGGYSTSPPLAHVWLCL